MTIEESPQTLKFTAMERDADIWTHLAPTTMTQPWPGDLWPSCIMSRSSGSSDAMFPALRSCVFLRSMLSWFLLFRIIQTCFCMLVIFVWVSPFSQDFIVTSSKLIRSMGYKTTPELASTLNARFYLVVLVQNYCKGVTIVLHQASLASSIWKNPDQVCPWSLIFMK